ncbi:MAG: holo-[acyl-carrier-protein] synthase [Chlamydiae bacterium CG10_big_fil_rev_8_21_14_0_10_35_9]|nr:MAG: holo-[acyl-carrier-protein] synthase [Chlamydiae bacterium CG10_big_fil_rev_8_21_14_0_10_35_9]
MNNILGIGSDIIEVDRIKKSIDKHGDHFLTRLFSPDEIKYCFEHKHPEIRVAGRFAAKEAVAKALGTGFGKKLQWNDFKILNTSSGKPEVFFQEKILAEMKNVNVLITISHCEKYAVAFALRVS